MIFILKHQAGSAISIVVFTDARHDPVLLERRKKMQQFLQQMLSYMNEAALDDRFKQFHPNMGLAETASYEALIEARRIQ